MKLHKNKLVNSRNTEKRSPFGQNVYIVNHKREHKFVSIAKGGITTLKLISATDDGVKVADKKEIHSKYPSNPDGKRVILISDDAFKGYKKVAVYRDPVSRFLSWYNDKIMHVYQPYLIGLGFLQDNSLERTMEFLEFELGKKDPVWIEEHVRPQSKIYRPDDVDVVVKLQDLDEYLESIGVPRVKNINKSKKTKTELSIWAEKKIKELYKDDYQLLRAVEDKLWSADDE